MLFTSPVLLFLFLPLVLGAYSLLGRRARNGFLLVASLLFYAWGEGTFVLVLCGSIAANYVFGRALDAPRRARACSPSRSPRISRSRDSSPGAGSISSSSSRRTPRRSIPSTCRRGYIAWAPRRARTSSWTGSARTRACRSDLRDDLRRAKANERVYQRTGSHWNERGAFVAYQRVIEALRPWYPELSALPREAFEDAVEEGPGSDLARMM